MKPLSREWIESRAVRSGRVIEIVETGQTALRILELTQLGVEQIEKCGIVDQGRVRHALVYRAQECLPVA